MAKVQEAGSLGGYTQGGSQRTEERPPMRPMGPWSVWVGAMLWTQP